MITLDETDLNQREKLVLEKYSEKPWRPEELAKELRTKMSRPTFYRAHRLLSDQYGEADKPGRRLKSSLIYVISDEEKRQFGLINSNGDLLKGKYYFRKDERKAQNWKKIMRKVEDYRGDKTPYHLLALVQREFSGYPFITARDVSKVVELITVAPKDDVYNSRHELFKFLEPQIKRLKNDPTEEDSKILAVSIRKIFDSSVEELLGLGEANVDEHQNKIFDILCDVYNEHEAISVIDVLFNYSAQEGKGRGQKPTYLRLD
ncbi:MAG: hypothetical protein AMDU1_APLC00062G0025 [Thermoplasmatales archaeon A-plasma]|nr:MAG: hypothetical protein AMDU1_APLC00062G0025 [Thermoplasmatales archaeon A-plasma]